MQDATLVGVLDGISQVADQTGGKLGRDGLFPVAQPGGQCGAVAIGRGQVAD